MSNYKFNITRVPLTEEEKRERAELFNKYEALPGEEVDVEEFVKKEIYDEYILLKCLKCDYEEKGDADIILECFNPIKQNYPISYCPKCNKPKLVPIDIYNQIKDNK